MSAIGDTLADRFQLRARLGGGGLGEVYVAWDVQASREVAVKVLDVAPIPVEKLTRLATALRSAAAVEHPAIVVPRIAIATSASPPFLAGEWIPGEDLAALRRRIGPLPWQRALDVVHACADGLKALAVATGSPHRALKPGNVRITPDDEVRVLDCAIAELGVQPVPADEHGVVAEYRAPEQLAGAPGDASADVYTLGVLLFELTTGVHPFTGATAFQAARAAMAQRAAPRPAELAPATPLPAQVEALIVRALAPQSSQRFQDVAELARHLALIRRSPGPTPRTHAAPAALPEAEDEPTQRSETPASLEDRTTIVSLPSTGEARSAPPLSAPVVSVASPTSDRAGETVAERTEVFPTTPSEQSADAPIVDTTVADRDDRTEVLPAGPQAADPTLVLPPEPVGEKKPAPAPRSQPSTNVRSADDDRTVLMVREARVPAAVRSTVARPPVAAPAAPAARKRSELLWPALLCLLSLGLALVALWTFART